MNNPGIDIANWERLKKKWADLQSANHKLEINFQLISDPKDEENILAIDVVQNVDNDVFTETVQRNPEEAHATLGIAGLSMEDLVGVYKKMMHQLHRQAGQRDASLTVTLSPSSSTSGEIRGILEKQDADGKSSILVNYRHYYVLNALREKMIGLSGDGWSKVISVYLSDELEFYFEY